ncbi:alanyl-tRNA editing protein [Microvirga makkahensis]|uniref:Alanyl-tRNA editing protein n=1 Tax=Microvirga makkahensis TaxID=1128670 RepID=A0A7X3MT56_9HYPH|nr:alanyl-tRNA editing protein [Microvirga makkahensis]MXQ12791.1 alanyl-tRNA editing protein [Microvirga makkahensis]
MPRYFCQDHPDQLELEALVLDSRPGAVLLAHSPFFPGGGGQVADRGFLEWSGGVLSVERIEPDPHGLWHVFAEPITVQGMVMAKVEAEFRRLMCELHTLAHVLNSIVYRDFGGALLTGAQLAADGTFRVDFDMPGTHPDWLRSLDGPINDVIRHDLAIRTFHMPWTEAEAEAGMFRSKSVSPPPQEDGSVRIVEIAGLDRQACGGTHLTSTGLARPVRILKVDNKGKQNRRIRVGFAD